MAHILLALFIAVPLRADIYDRLDELTHHLRSGGMPNKAAINDRVGDRDVLVLFDSETATAIPYSRVVRDEVLTFRIFSRTGDLPLAFADVETDSEWNMLGEALAGPLKGAQLEQIPAYNSMWFGWSTYWPETRLWNGEGILPPP